MVLLFFIPERTDLLIFFDRGTEALDRRVPSPNRARHHLQCPLLSHFPNRNQSAIHTSWRGPLVLILLSKLFLAPGGNLRMIPFERKRQV